MIKDVVNSLMHDKIRTFFCWITFTLTSMFIFLFFTVAMSDSVGVTMYHAKSDIPTILMIASVILCSIEIVFANDFFIKNKAKSLAVRLVCGATYTQNAGYLLLQTVLILLVAVPVGIIGGLCLLPVINQLLVSVMHEDIVIALNFQSVLWAFLVLGYVIFWTLLLNLSFSYRNSAAQLLNSNSLKMPVGKELGIGGKAGKSIMTVLHFALWIVPVCLSYYDKSLVLICTIASLGGFVCVLGDLILPMIDQRIQHGIGNPEKIISLGFFRTDLKVLRFSILLFIISSTLLISLLTSTENAVYQILVLITYVAMNCLLSLSIMFKYANELNDRPMKFKTLSHIGYMEDACKRIIRAEVVKLYLFIIVIVLFYLINIFATLYLGGILAINHIAILLIGSIMPMVVCGFISWAYYRKTVFGK